MRSFDSIAGAAGIAFLVVGTLVVGEAMTIVTGTYWHWLPLVLGIVVGLMAVASINR